MDEELSLYKLDPTQSRLQSIFITLHTIKGSALIADNKELATRAHQLEDLIISKNLMCLVPKLDFFLSCLKSSTRSFMDSKVNLGDVISELEIYIINKARELNKKIELCVSCESIKINNDVAIDLKNISTQLLTNALVHGIARDIEKTKIEIQVSVSDKFLTLEVSDNGKGIKSVEKCLEPGVSERKASDLVAGRGVGLNVVKTIVARLGGRLLISSTEGVGSSFKIIIPKANI